MVKSKNQTAEEGTGGKSGTNMPSSKQTKVTQKEREKMKQFSEKTAAVEGAPLTPQLANPIRVDHVPSYFNGLNDEDWKLSRLRNICVGARKKALEGNAFQPTYGNTIFHAWDQDIDVGVWPICSDLSQPFLGNKNELSWELMVDHFLKAHQGDWMTAERSIRVSLDRYAPQSSLPFVKTRQLAMCLSRCDPIMLFSLSQEEDPTTWCNRFWDKCNARDPRLLVEQRPVVKFWLICSFLLDHPWVDPVITDLPEDFEALQKKPFEEPKRDGAGDPMVDDPKSPARVGMVELNGQNVNEISSPPKQVKPAGEQPAGWNMSEDPKTVTPGGEGVIQNKQNDQVRGADNWSASDDGKAKKPTSSSRQLKVPMSIDLEQLPIRTAKSVAFQSLQQSSEESAKIKSNREKFQSDAELARKAHQIRMDGIPRKHSKFVCLSVSTYWPGEEEADGKLQDMMARVIVDGMVQAMSQTPDLMFMPVGDYTFSDQTKWITNGEQATKDLVSWDKLRIYLDLAWNNGFNLPRQIKTPGDKVLRTRIRIAFDSEENLVEPMLDDIYRPTGYGMGIYRSPLQVGNAVKIGWLLNYPVGMGREAVERELMRHFDFKVPIALVLAYPSNPGSYTEKWVSGIHKHAWHVYVPLRFAKMAEQELSIWLTKSTAKRDMPFGSSTQFVIDWNYARSQDQIPVQDLNKDIIQMINTHDTHCHTTEIIKPSFPIHPLVKIHVPFFDKSVSLLRILYSIQCHPEAPKEKQIETNSVQKDGQTGSSSQSDQAVPTDMNKGKESNDQAKVQSNESMDQEKSDDPKSPDKKKRKDANASPQPSSVTTSDVKMVQKTPDRKKKGKRKRKKASTPSKTTPSTPGQDALIALERAVTPADKVAIAAAQQAQTPETVEQLQARLLLKDATNFQPSMLFLLILPSEVEGYMIFVVRKKFKALAESILNNLAAFLIYHLELWKDPENERRTLRQWLCKRHLELTTRYGMTWDERTLTAVSELDKNEDMNIDENDDWLNALTPANTSSSVFKGTISLNLKLASVKGIDDGATVVSRINEIRRLQLAAQQHAEVVDELNAKEKELQAKDKALNEKDAIIQRLQAQLASQQIDGTKKPQKTKSRTATLEESDDSDDEDYVDNEDDEDDDDEDIAGEYEMDEEDGESEFEEMSEPANPEGNEGDDITGQHNDDTAQADAGGGSSGSGS